MKKGINKLKCGAFLSERCSQFVALYKILRIPSIGGDMVRVKKFYQYNDTSRVEIGSSFISTTFALSSTTIKISHINEIFKHKILSYSFLKIKNISKVYT